MHQTQEGECIKVIGNPHCFKTPIITSKLLKFVPLADRSLLNMLAAFNYATTIHVPPIDDW